ncbi:AIPR family protein [Kitasatospora sp. NPDC051705]|uniref:AIPR family protein n=1 Tax=Kitasatospora sp. NPDC051705 TaxID=3364057 RepID=UPI003796643D
MGSSDEARVLDQVLALRIDLDRKRYGSNKRLLFALQLHQGIDDIHSVAAESLTDGGGDVSADLVHIDREGERLIIAQAYTAKDPGQKQSSKATKAQDLNTAVAWLLAGQPEALVPRMRPTGRAIDQAFRDGVIKEVQFWYVHNLPESDAVQAELDATARQVTNVLAQIYPGCGVERVLGVEIGVRTLYRWYEGSRSPILVTDELEVTVDGFFELGTGKWRALCTAVDTAWLQNLYWAHNDDGEDRLFSANVRGFVGVKGRKGVINSAIRKTVEEQPENLFILNNGITALTRGITTEPDAAGRTRIKLDGISIVNGAQTTGAVSGDTPRTQTEAAKVMIKFIVCEEPSLVEDVISTTNRQLATQAADFRSNDRTQLRLVREFRDDLGGIVYDGGRRTAPSEISGVVPANRIVAVTAGKALAAFHGMPLVAANQSARIWSPEEKTYVQLFGEHTSARHLLFCYSLQRAVEDAKAEYREKCIKDPDLKGPEREVYDFFQIRGSIPLLISAVAECMEPILDHGITDPFALAFARRPQIDTAIRHWARVLKPLIPYVADLAPALTRGVAVTGTGDFDRAKAVSDARKRFARSAYTQRLNPQSKTAYDTFCQTLAKAP